jgi:hypothetical protein
LLGGLFGKKSSQQAAASMNPWNVSGMFGSASFDPRTRTANLTGDPMQQQLRGMMGQNAMDIFSGNTPYSPFMGFSQGLGNNELPALFGQYQEALQGMPTDAYNQYQGQLSNAQGIANQDTQGLMANRLQLLRDQAAPFEGRAMDSLQNRLFSQGRMGSTGGGLEMEAFGRGLGQADTERQMQAQQLGIQAQNQNLAQAGLLSELAGTGFANALNYNDIGVNRAAQRMQNAMGMFGFGADLMNTQQGQAYNGLQGMLGIDSNMMNLGALGKNIASSPQQAQLQSSSPLGSLFSGMGAKMMGGMDWSQIFKKGP